MSGRSGRTGVGSVPWRIGPQTPLYPRPDLPVTVDVGTLHLLLLRSCQEASLKTPFGISTGEFDPGPPQPLDPQKQRSETLFGFRLRTVRPLDPEFRSTALPVPSWSLLRRRQDGTGPVGRPHLNGTFVLRACH